MTVHEPYIDIGKSLNVKDSTVVSSSNPIMALAVEVPMRDIQYCPVRRIEMGSESWDSIEKAVTNYHRGHSIYPTSTKSAGTIENVSYSIFQFGRLAMQREGIHFYPPFIRNGEKGVEFVARVAVEVPEKISTYKPLLEVFIEDYIAIKYKFSEDEKSALIMLLEKQKIISPIIAEYMRLLSGLEAQDEASRNTINSLYMNSSLQDRNVKKILQYINEEEEEGEEWGGKINVDARRFYYLTLNTPLAEAMRKARLSGGMQIDEIKEILSSTSEEIFPFILDAGWRDVIDTKSRNIFSPISDKIDAAGLVAVVEEINRLKQ